MRALRNGGLRGSQSQKVLPGAEGAAMTASRPRPATVPAQHAYVFVRSASPERQQELAQLAAAAGFAARVHATSESALDELATILAPNSREGLPAAILVDVFDEDGDGAIDQAEMSWPLLRMVQRPHAPYDERLRRVFVLVISETVAASPRLTLDAFGAGARMVTPSDDDCKHALELLRLTSVKTPGQTAKRAMVRCPTCGHGLCGNQPVERPVQQKLQTSLSRSNRRRFGSFLDESIALVEFSKRSRRVRRTSFHDARIEVGLKI